MQISAISSSSQPAGPSSSAYTAIVSDYAATLSDKSGASTDDKVAAYLALSKLLDSAPGTFLRTNVAAKDAAVEATNYSDFAKRVSTLGDQYTAIGMSKYAANPDNQNGNQTQLDIFSRFSADDQKVVFLAMGLNLNYSSMDAALADFKKKADAFVAQPDATPAVQVTLSDRAKALMASDSSAATPAQQAMKTLSGKSDANNASVGLQLLKKAAEASDAAKAAAKDAANSNDTAISTTNSAAAASAVASSTLDSLIHLQQGTGSPQAIDAPKKKDAENATSAAALASRTLDNLVLQQLQQQSTTKPVS